MNWVMILSVATGVLAICTAIAQGLKEKKDNDERIQDKNEIIKLQKESNDSLKSTNSLQQKNLELQEQVLFTQNQFSELQKLNNDLQLQLFNQVLGGYNIKKSFSSFALIDPNTNLPIIIGRRNISRLGRMLKSISNIGIAFHGILENLPLDDTRSKRVQVSDFLQQAMQYKILLDMFSFQDKDFSLDTPNDNYDYLTPSDYIINNPIKLSSFTEINFEDIFTKKYGRNIKLGQETKMLKVPQGTILEIDNTKESDSIYNFTYKIILTNKDYFKIEFDIADNTNILKYNSIGPAPKKLQDLISSTGILEGNNSIPELYTQSIVMKGTFNEKAPITSKVVEYKKWCEWIFERLKEINSIPK